MKFFWIELLLIGILFSGCNEKGPDPKKPDADPAVLDKALRPLQGEWEVENNRGRLTIDGRTLRLIFKSEETGNLYRRNVYIESINVEGHELKMRGETLPWRYGISEHGQKDSIMLRFYDEVDHVWLDVVMVRTSDEPARM